MLTPDLLDQAAASSTATLHEAAGRIGAPPAALTPLSPTMRVVGRAYPVRSPGGDNLWLHRAICAAAAGDVLVVATGGATEFGYWGEVMTRAARHRHLGGLVIEGGVRDAAALIEAGFPVFAAAVCIRGTVKDPQGDGALGEPATIGGVTVRADLERLVTATVKRFGGVDVMVPNAGVAKVVSFADSDEQAIHQQFSVNFVGALQTARLFLGSLHENV